MADVIMFNKIADFIHNWNFAEDFPGTLATGLAYTFFCNDELGVHIEWKITSGGIGEEISNDRRIAAAEKGRQEELAKIIEEFGLNCNPEDYFIVIEDEDAAEEMFGDDFVSTPKEAINTLLMDFDKLYEQYHAVSFPQHEEAYRNMISKAHEKLLYLARDLDIEISY